MRWLAVSTFAKAQWFTAFLGVAAAALVVQNIRISLAFEDMRARLIYEARDVVADGDRLAVLVGFTPEGMRIEESIVGRQPGTLVIGMSALCPTCLENMAAWQRIAAHAVSRGLTVIWVSRDSPETMLKFGGNLPGPVVVDPTYSTFRALKLRVVPQTLLIDGEGVVRDAAAGLLDAATEESIGAAIEDLVGPANTTG